MVVPVGLVVDTCEVVSDCVMEVVTEDVEVPVTLDVVAWLTVCVRVIVVVGVEVSDGDLVPVSV